MNTSEKDFTAYVAARQRGLQRSAWLITGDWASAQDLVQSTLLTVWRKWPSVRAADDCDAYVHRIMVNKAADDRRRFWHREMPTSAPPVDVTRADEVDVALEQTLLAALRSLPPRQRTTLVVRFFNDFTEAQTAWVMGCSVGTVKSQTAKALGALKTVPGLADLRVEGATR